MDRYSLGAIAQEAMASVTMQTEVQRSQEELQRRIDAVSRLMRLRRDAQGPQKLT